MKKSLSFILMFFTVLIAFGQNDKSSKVETKLLVFPMYNINEIDPATVSAEFVAGDLVFAKEKMKDKKTTCKPKGGTIKDAVEVSTYYYEVPYTTPLSYIVAKDAKGNIVYAQQVSDSKPEEAKFGYDKCEYWVADKMKKDWEKQSAGFKNKIGTKVNYDLYNLAIELAKTNVYPSFRQEEIEVYTAKGRSFDYTTLDNTQETVIDIYKNIGKNGINADAYAKLNEAIKVWEKELQEVNLDDRKARISKDVALGLYENIMNANLYTYQLEKAINAGLEIKKIFGNFSNNRSRYIEERIQLIANIQIGANKNEQIISDLNQLNAIGQQIGAKSVAVKKLPASDFPKLKSEYIEFSANMYSEKMNASDKMTEDKIAAGEINPYDKYIIQGGNGKPMMLTPLTMAPELTALPKEICEITDLTSLTIMLNKIATIPPEIGNLKELTKLDLSKNMITALPAEIGGLTKLEDLSLKGNQITKLPAEMGNLKNLEKLDLSDNPITEFPEEMKNCTSLKKIVLKGTNISAEQQALLSKWFPDAKIKY